MSLEKLRTRIDAIDEELVRLLNERTALAAEIGRVKIQRGNEVYAPTREREVLDHVAAVNRGPLDRQALGAIYREIMSAALALESAVKVAYLGPPFTYTHKAARDKFGSSVEYVACETIADVFDVVHKRKASYGVVPVENSTEGAVTNTLDKFVDSPLKICAEVYMPISICLVSRGDRRGVRRIYSKQEVFGQCRQWLQREMPGVELMPAASTAKAAELAAGEDGAAALASSLAAESYGLTVLDRDVQDFVGNMTRFLVIGQSYAERTGRDKTSVFFSIKHEPGSLYGALSSFRTHGLNMTRIESRPSKSRAWEYYFFVDVEGHVKDEAVANALADMSTQCVFMTVMGSYPRAETI